MAATDRCPCRVDKLGARARGAVDTGVRDGRRAHESPAGSCGPALFEMELRFSNFQDARHGVDRRLGARSAVEKKRTSAEWTQWISYFYRISRESKKERGKETRSQRRTCWEGSIRWPARLKKSSAALLHRHVCFRFVRSLHVACSQLPASKLRRRMKIRSVHPSTTHDELAIPIVQTRQSLNAC
jgi:hypothetical protein